MGWNALARHAAVGAARRARRQRRLLRPQLRGRAGERRRGRRGRARRARRRRGRARRARGRPVPSRAQRRRRRARARERAAMVKKRVIPCLDVAGGRVVKGVRFEVAARRRRPGRARDPLLRARRRRARVPRHHCDDRRAPADARARRARCRAARRSRSRSAAAIAGARGRPRRCCAPAPTRSPSTAPRVDDPGSSTALADEFGAQAVVCAIDARAGEVVTARRPQAARTRCGRVGEHGGEQRRRRDPAHLDRRGRHARGLRPRADALGGGGGRRCP